VRPSVGQLPRRLSTGRRFALATLTCGVASIGCGGGAATLDDAGGGDRAGEGGGCPLGEPQRTLPAGGIRAATTLYARCSPYYLAGPLMVTAPLTIEAGVKVETCSASCDSRLTITGFNGRLTAIGSAEAPIVFSPRVPGEGRPGEWTGLMIRDTLGGSALEHVIIEYAGGATTGRPEFGDDRLVNAGLVLWDTPGVSIKNTTFRHNRHYGLRVKYRDADNDMQVLRAFTGNTFQGNTTAAMRWPVNQLGAIGVGNCFAGRDPSNGACRALPIAADARAEGALVEGEQGESRAQFVTRNATWRALDVPYRLLDGVIIEDAALEIAEPNEIWVDIGSITVGLNSPGSLKAVAKAPNGIRFRSAKEVPAAGDWDGILFEERASGAGSALENVEVAHGGRASWRAGEGKAGIWIYNAGPVIKNAYVHHTNGGAIHWNCHSSAIVENPTFDNVQCKPEARQNWGCPCTPFVACKPTCQ